MARKNNLAVLDLASITTGMPGLSSIKASALVEAAEVCLDAQGHRPDTTLVVRGEFSTEYSLHFKEPAAGLHRTYADEPEATEEGAVAVAIAVMLDRTDYVVVERSVKTTGFDYWLGRKEGIFEARLEVSGIRHGSKSLIRKRVTQKLEQMAPSDHGGLPGYAVVVEFGKPCAQVVRK